MTEALIYGLAANHVRDEGVAGSNPATPTSYTPKALISRIYLKPQINYDPGEYTSRDTSGRFGWWAYVSKDDLLKAAGGDLETFMLAELNRALERERWGD